MRQVADAYAKLTVAPVEVTSLPRLFGVQRNDVKRAIVL
jgi:hypothetical protein